jgi:hypothetical protein
MRRDADQHAFSAAEWATSGKHCRRLFDPPIPVGTVPVSPHYVTFAMSPPSWSATICASMVLVLCPMAAAPV